MTANVCRHVWAERNDFKPVGARGFERGVRQHARDAPAFQRGRNTSVQKGDVFAVALVGEHGNLTLHVYLVTLFVRVIHHGKRFVLSAQCGTPVYVAYGYLFRLEISGTMAAVAERLFVRLAAATQRHAAIFAQ